MKVKVISEIESARGVIPVGSIIEISGTLLDKLQGKVEPILEARPDEGRGLPHYCQTGACWCSALLPDRDHPADCILSACEYFKD